MTTSKTFRPGDVVKLPEWLGGGKATVRTGRGYVPPASVSSAPPYGGVEHTPVTPAHGAFNSPPVWIANRYLVLEERPEPGNVGDIYKPGPGQVYAGHTFVRTDRQDKWRWFKISSADPARSAGYHTWGDISR